MAANLKVVKGNLSFIKSDSEIIGQGENSKVYRGLYKEDTPLKTEVAIKCIYKSLIPNPNQLKLWKDLEDHPNVVKCYDIGGFDDADDCYFVGMQLCQGPLEKLVKNRQFYGNIESDKEVLLQVIQGVKWLSDNKVAYRSLNPFNILVSFAKGETQPRIKLGDFFISRMQKSDKNVITNSGNNRNPNWSAPEILKGKSYTPQADVFSCGLVFAYFLSNGTHPFGSSNQHIQIMLNKEPIMPPKITDPNATDLISRMLQANPENRIPIDKTLCHPFFWSADKSLTFIVASKKVLDDLSKQRDPISTRDIEANKNLLFTDNWVDQLTDIVKRELRQGRYGPKGDQEKYVCHLITTIRNLSEHIKEKSNEVKTELLSKGKFYDYWADIFPGLLVHTWKVFLANLDHEAVKNSEVSAFYN